MNESVLKLGLFTLTTLFTEAITETASRVTDILWKSTWSSNIWPRVMVILAINSSTDCVFWLNDQLYHLQIVKKLWKCTLSIFLEPFRKSQTSQTKFRKILKQSVSFHLLFSFSLGLKMALMISNLSVKGQVISFWLTKRLVGGSFRF